MSDHMHDVNYNMEKLSDYIKADPLMDDVKEKIENAYPIENVASIDELRSLVSNKMLFAELITGQKANVIVIPLLIEEEEDKKLFQSNLGRYLKRKNYAFNVSWKSAPKLLEHDLAVPVENIDSSLIDEIVKSSRSSIVESMPKELAGSFEGANPKCIALSVYKNSSHFVIWDFTWKLKKDENLFYAHEFQKLLLHREIPIVGGNSYEGFLLVGTDAEIQKTVDPEQNLKRVAEKLKLVTKNIKDLGFDLENISNGISYIPYPLKELASWGVFRQSDSKIKDISEILKELSGITNEQILRNERFNTKKDIVESLFESISWRIANPNLAIYREFKSVRGVTSIADDLGIAKEDITSRKLGALP